MFSWIQSLDEAIQLFLQTGFGGSGIHNAILDAIMIVITSLGDSGIFWIALGLLFLFFKRTRRYGIAVLVVLAVEFAIGEGIIKHLVARPRPYNVLTEIKTYVPLLTSYSFPSGHAMSSFATAVTLLQCDKKYGIPALVLAFLIAFSRIYLFMHWPSDVIFGALFGTIVSLLVMLLIRRFWARADAAKSAENKI